MRSIPRFLALVAFLPCAAVGCGDGCVEHIITPGELGVAEFEWEWCHGELFESCPILEAIAAGATTSIHVYNGDRLPPYEVRSSDPTLAVFTPADGHVVRVEAVRPGEVALELYAAADGALLDRIRLRIAEVAAIEMTRPAETPPLALMQDGDLELVFQTREASGEVLVGSGAVSFEAAGGLSVAARGEPGERFDRVVVRADAAGRAVLAARAGTAALDVLVSVVTPNQVAEVQIDESISPLPPPSDGGTFWIRAEARLRDGTLVHRPRCTWSSSDSSCLFFPGETQSDPDRCAARLDRLRSRCRAAITVTVGAFASDTARIEVE